LRKVSRIQGDQEIGPLGTPTEAVISGVGGDFDDFLHSHVLSLFLEQVD
jgi:hypothetical protein